MMQFLSNNRTLSKYILAFFVVLALFAPVSFSITTGVDTGSFISSIQIQVESNVAYAVVTKIMNATVDFIINTLGNILLTLSAFATQFCGMLLDFALTFSVFEMGSLITSTGKFGATIDRLWGVIRDICNLAFIFGFIYVGIRTILDPDSADTKRFLSRIIIGALLINFSLFFVKIIVDFSNFTALQIYNAMLGNTSTTISQVVTNLLGVITLFKVPGPEALAKLTDGKSFWFFAAGSIFLLTTAFVFLAAAVLLIIRFVALVLIMIASPLLFAATVFPQTEHFASDLWKKLISYSFFAPAYLLLTLISITILQSLELSTFGSQKIQLGAGFVDSLSTLASASFGTILQFVVVIFFMIASLVVASKMGVMGGEMAVRVGKSAQGVIGRNTVGLASEKLLKRYEKFDAENKDKATWKVARTMLGGDRVIHGVIESGKKAKFGSEYSRKDDKEYDKELKARQANIKKAKELEDIIAGPERLDATLSDEERSEKQIEFERKIADSTVKDFEELKQDQRKAIVDIMTQSQIDGLMKSEKLTETEKDELGVLRQEKFAELYKPDRDKLAKASSDNLAALGAKYLAQEENAMYLTSTQMDDLKKKLTPTEFTLVSTAREKALEKLADRKSIKSFTGGNEIYKNYELITRQKPGEIAKMPAKVLLKLSENPATQLPISTLSKISQEGTLSYEDQKAIRANVKIYSEGNWDDSDDYKKWLEDSPLGRQFGK